MSNSTVRFMQGNEALVEGAIVAGARFFAGYPITPASEITEGMSARLPLVAASFCKWKTKSPAWAQPSVRLWQAENA